MIQRIQTLYLALALVSLSMLFFMPICFYEAGGVEFTTNIKNVLGSDGSVNPTSWGIGLMILGPITVLLLIFMISQFKYRKKQLAIGRGIYLLLASLIIISMMVIESNKPEDGQITGYWIGYFAPVAALPLVFLANRAIKKDEELVKSLDRLR